MSRRQQIAQPQLRRQARRRSEPDERSRAVPRSPRGGTPAPRERGAGVGQLSCDGRSARLASARLCESADRLRVALRRPLRLPSYAAAAACRSAAAASPICGATRFPRQPGLRPAWQGCSARAAASSRRATVQTGSVRRTTVRLPATPKGVRAAAAWPCELDRAPVATRRGPPCLRGASARTARLPRCGTWPPSRRRISALGRPCCARQRLNGRHHSTASRAPH